MSNNSTNIFPFRPFQKDLATKKLDKFKNYPNGWHGGEGIPFSESIIDKALHITILVQKLGFEIVDAFPATDGTLGVYTYSNGFHIDIDISESEKYQLLVEDDDDIEHYRDLLTLEELEFKLIDLKTQWDTYEYLPAIIGIQTKVDLKVGHLKTRLVEQSLSLTWHAVYCTPDIYADI